MNIRTGLDEETLKQSVGACGLITYLDSRSKRFVVPFKYLQEHLTMGILELLANGWAMNCLNSGGNRYYVIFNIKKEAEGQGKVSNCKERLYEMCHNEKIRYFGRIPLDTYFAREDYQKVIDNILEEAVYFDNCVNDWNISMICNGNELVFNEFKGVVLM